MTSGEAQSRASRQECPRGPSRGFGGRKEFFLARPRQEGRRNWDLICLQRGRRHHEFRRPSLGWYLPSGVGACPVGIDISGRCVSASACESTGPPAACPFPAIKPRSYDGRLEIESFQVHLSHSILDHASRLIGPAREGRRIVSGEPGEMLAREQEETPGNRRIRVDCYIYSRCRLPTRRHNGPVHHHHQITIVCTQQHRITTPRRLSSKYATPPSIPASLARASYLLGRQSRSSPWAQMDTFDMSDLAIASQQPLLFGHYQQQPPTIKRQQVSPPPAVPPRSPQCHPLPAQWAPARVPRWCHSI